MMHIEGIRMRERKLRIEKGEHKEVERTYYSPALRKERKESFEYETHSQRDTELRRLELKRLSLQEKLQSRLNRLAGREKKGQQMLAA